MNEDTEELDDTLKTIKGDVYELTNNKVSIMEDEDTYKSTYQILKEISQVWDELSDKNQAQLLDKLFGKTRAQIGAAVISNFSQAEKAITTMKNSAGSANEEMGIITDSLSYKLNALKETITGIWQNLIDRGSVGKVIDLFTGVLNVVDLLTKHLGLLGTAIAGLAIYKVVKNFSSIKTFITEFSAIRNVGDLVSHLKAGFEGVASAIGVSTAALGTFLIVAGGIFAIVKIVDALTESYEESREKFQNAKQNLENTQAEISNVNAELDNTKKRLQELEGKRLTAVEQNEYDRLKAYNDQLERQKELLENSEKIQREDAAKTAYAALTNKSFTPLQPTDLIGKIESETARIKEFEEHGVPQTDRTYIDWITNRAKHISDALEYSNSLIGADGKVIDGYQDVWDRLFNAIENTKSDEQLASEKAQKKVDSIQNILKTYKKGYDAIQLFAKDKGFGISVNDLASNKDVKESGLLGAILGSGFTLTDFVNQINSDMGALNEQSVDREIKRIISSTKLLSGSTEGVNKLFNIFKELSSKNQIDALNKLKENKNVFQWGFGDFVDFFSEISKTLVNGKTELEIATDKFDEINDKFTDFNKEATRYQNLLTTVQSVNKGTGNSVTSDMFYSESTVKSIREQIEALAGEDTEEAKKKIAELNEQLTAQLDLKDISVALEYQNGAYSYNLDLVNEIIDAKRKEALVTKELQKADLQSQYLKNAETIMVLRREIENTTNAEIRLAKQQELEEYLLQNSQLANQAKQYELVCASINEATDAYHNWLNAQNAAESGDMFDSAKTALKELDKTLNDDTYENFGKTGKGRAIYQAAVDFVIPDTVDKEDQDAVNEYLKSIGKYLILDDSKNIKGLNIETFLEEATNAGLMLKTIEGDRTKYNLAGEMTMEEFAKGMNMSLPLVTAIFGELEEYPFEFDWSDEAGKSLIDLKVDAIEAAEALRSFEKLENFDIGINTDNVEEATVVLDEKIKQIQDFKASPEIDASSIVYANQIIEYLVRQKQDLQEPLVMSVNSDEISTAYAEVIKKLQEFQTAKNNLDAQIALGVDEDTINASRTKVNELANEISGLNAKFDLGIEDSSAEGVEKYIKEITSEKLIEFGVDPDKVEEYSKKKIDNNNATVHWGNDLSAVNSFISAPLSKTGMVNWQSNNTGLLPTWSRAGGTANVGGNWGNNNTGRTLVGEEGFEIVSDPRTGKWYTVGDNGAEFVYLPKNAIVFNHRQSQGLLLNGSINGYGKSMASGNAMVTGGGYLPKQMKADTASKDASTTKSAWDNAATATTQAANTVQQAAQQVTDTTHDTENNVNETVDDVDNKTDEILDTFNKWLDKMFDWVEIRISRLSNKIEKTVEKAERKLADGSYNSAAKQYVKAISNTLTLQKNEQWAKNKYISQADKVMENAINSGLISNVDAETIKKRDKNGSIYIAEYSDRIKAVVSEYQNWMDKAREASDSIDTLHDKIRDYTESLKKVRDAQRDAKIGVLDVKLSVGTGGNSERLSLQNKQLSYTNTVLRKKNDAYAKTVENTLSDIKNARTNAKSAVNKQIKKGGDSEYLQALNQAKSDMASSKKVSSSTLKTIKKGSQETYEYLYAYNLGLDNLEVAKQEASLNYAETSAEIYQNISKYYENRDTQIESAISLLRQKSENSEKASQANKYLNQVTSKYQSILDEDKLEIDKFSDLQSKNATTISGKGKTNKLSNASNSVKNNVDSAIQSAKQSAKKGDFIEPSVLASLASYYEDGYITLAFYQACIDYNNAHDGLLQATAQKEIDEQTVKANNKEIALQKFQNVKEKYNFKQEGIAGTRSFIQSQQGVKTVKGLSLDKSDYKSLINSVKLEIESLENEYNALDKTLFENLEMGLWDRGTEEYTKAQMELEAIETAIQKAKQSQIEYNNAIAQLPYESVEKALKNYDALEKYLNSVVKLRQAEGVDLDVKHYQKQIDANNEMIAKYTEMREQAKADMSKAKKDDEGVYGGKTYEEWQTLYRDYGTTINELLADNESLKDALRDDVYWRDLERAHEASQRLQNTIKGISDLLSDEMYYNKDGILTEYGIAKISTLVKQYETAREEVNNYMFDIEQLNNLYKDGWYTQEEYTKKLNELQTSVLSSASSMKQYSDSIIDMYKTIDQKELETLYKLIDARSDALDKKKEYVEYSKNISKQNNDILGLQSELAALEGINTLEAIAKRKKLELELSEKQEALDETVQNHIFDLSKDGLSQLKETLQESFDDRWEEIGSDLEKISTVIGEATALTTTSMDAINTTLQTLLKHYGIDASFASGTTGVPRKLRARVGESGSEIITTNNGLIMTLDKGSGVIPNDMTENLMLMAQGIIPNILTASSSIPSVDSIRGGDTKIEQHYDSLIHIDGSADAATVEDIKRMTNDLLDKSYQYTSKKIYEGHIKAGGRRTV